MTKLVPASYNFRYRYIILHYLFNIHHFRIIDNNTGGERKTWFTKSFTDTGDGGVVEDFYATLKSLEPRIYNRLKPEEPMVLTELEQTQFEGAKNCYSCGNKFSDWVKGDKNRDHNHMTG